jgi:hypothetical protein
MGVDAVNTFTAVNIPEISAGYSKRIKRVWVNVQY